MQAFFDYRVFATGIEAVFPVLCAAIQGPVLICPHDAHHALGHHMHINGAHTESPKPAAHICLSPTRCIFVPARVKRSLLSPLS